MDSKRREVMPLDEAAAINYGSEFVGEFFIYSVAIAVLMTEYISSATKAAAKEQRQAARLQSMEDNISLLLLEVEELRSTARSASERAEMAKAAADAARVAAEGGGRRSRKDRTR